MLVDQRRLARKASSRWAWGSIRSTGSSNEVVVIDVDACGGPFRGHAVGRRPRRRLVPPVMRTFMRLAVGRRRAGQHRAGLSRQPSTGRRLRHIHRLGGRCGPNTIKLGVFFFGGVELADAGAGPPAPMTAVRQRLAWWRRILRRLGAVAERLGYDSSGSSIPFPARGLRGRPQRDPDHGRESWLIPVADPPRARCSTRPGVRAAAAGRGLRHAAGPVRGPGHLRRWKRNGPGGGAGPQRQGRARSAATRTLTRWLA